MLVVGLVSLLLGTSLFVGTAPHAGSRTLCLAIEFPTASDSGSWDKGSWAVTLEHAVQLAVQQNQDLGSGYTLRDLDYSESPDTTAQQDPRQATKNVTQMVQTPCILGMVGPVSSHVAAVEMPITANAGLAMVSPANTMPGLTLRLYAADYGLAFDHLHPAGKPTNYFRIIVNDAFQGRELAELASHQPPVGLGARNAFVVDDHTPYGEVVAGGFTQEFLSQGGAIVGTDGIPVGGTARIAELAARIVAASPDVVCFGGDGNGGGALLQAQLAAAGYAGLFVGGDGIAQDPAFLAQAGATADHEVYAINPVSDSSHLSSGAAARLLHDFQARYPGEDVDGYGANAYDAAMVLITAMKNLIRAGKAVTRQHVLDQVQHIQYAGVTGHVSFDHNGDNANGVFSLYTVQGGRWVWVKQDTV
jgi:branched-chain amino acid transport system substrate-binding protein